MKLYSERVRELEKGKRERVCIWKKDERWDDDEVEGKDGDREGLRRRELGAGIIV